MTYRNEVLADSPSAFFEFNEASGTTVTSSVGTVTGSVTGTIGMGQTGIPTGGKSVYFNGSGSQLVISDYADFMANPSWTVESWVKMPTTLTTDYPTFYRRDGGGKTFLVRGRGPGAASRINIIESYVSGNTVDTGTTTYNNDTWTHVVTTLSGGVQRLYINGVLATVSNGTIAAGGTGTAAPFYIGNGGNAAATSESMVGNITNVAIYNTVALSQARITAHYNAGIDGNSIVVTTPATMSAVALTPVVSTIKDATVAVAPATADLTAPNAVVNFDTAPKAYGPYSYSGYWQQIQSGGSGQYFASDPARDMQQFVAKHAQSFTIPSSEVSKTSKVMLKLTMAPATSAFSDHNVTVSQLEKTATGWFNHTFMNPVTVTYPPASANESNTREFDITPIVKSWDAGGPKYGLAIDMRGGPGGIDWVVSNYTVDIYLPTKVVTYSVSPLTGSLMMTNVLVTAVQGAKIDVGSASASALMLDPTVETVDSVSFSVSPMTASAYIASPIMPNAKVEVGPMAISGVINSPLTVAGTGITVGAGVSMANALMNDALASNRTDAVINVEFMRSSAVLKDTTQSANPRMNPYYQRVSNQIDFDDKWLAFLEKSGPYYIDEVILARFPEKSGSELTGNPAWKYFGDPAIGVAGPGDRPATYFDGIDDYIVMGDENDHTPTPTYTYEFVIKTTKKNQIISTGSEFLPNYLYPRKDIVEIRDGHLMVTHQIGETITKEFVTGIRDIADGQWHHVVITNWWYSEADRRDYPPFGNGEGMGIWIDGKLDKRSWAPDYLGTDTGLLTNPDVIGKGTNSANYFEGHLSMFVARKGYTLSKYDIEQNYYAALAVSPVRVGAAQATAVMPNTKAKGNTIRVLYLRHKPITSPGYINDGTEYVAGSDGVGFDSTTARLVDYTMTNQQTFGLTGGYRNPITDERRLIDLRIDRDVENYDMIYIEDSVQDTINYLSSSLRTTPQHAKALADDFYDSVRWAVVEKGVELYIDDAQIAKEIGFIDDYVMHQVNYETDTSADANLSRPGAGRLGSPWAGQYDYWGWMNNPWGQRVNPYQYTDTHFTAGERIVATEPGLTDTPGYTLAEVIYRDFADPFSGDGAEYSMRYEPNSTGLKLGQEMLFMNRMWLPDGSNGVHTPAAVAPVVSVPPEFVNAGTVIAKEMANDWIKDQRPANPYADNATIIIIKEGDLINGTPTKGRVAISPNDSWYAPAKINIGLVRDSDTPEQKKWQTSNVRVTGGSYVVIDQGGKVVDVTQPTPTPQPGEVPEPPRKGGLWYLFQPNPIAMEKVANGDMGLRLYRWLLADKLEVGDGDVRVSVNAMTANASLVDPTSEGSRSVTINTGSMLASAQMSDLVGANRSASYHAFPMTASAVMNERVMKIVVPPMTASAIMVSPNFDDLFASGDLVSLTLNKTEGRMIVVYLRSEKS